MNGGGGDDDDGDDYGDDDDGDACMQRLSQREAGRVASVVEWLSDVKMLRDSRLVAMARGCER